MELYKGDIEAFRKVLQRERQKMKPDDKHKLENLRVLLQLVNAYLLLGDTKSACSLATELISLVPDIDGDVVHNPPNRADVPSGRVLSLMCCSINELLPYTIDIITSSVKEIAFSDSCTDVAIGQLMVLSQYKWPKDVDCFNKLILLVQTRGSFTYTKFFKYIINIEMLEEIMYLANQTSVKLNLISLENSSRIRAVTRGVKNKVKEDLTVATDKQLSRCDESVNDVLKLFLKNEKLCFIGGGDD
jgi:integrator complex subunit 10